MSAMRKLVQVIALGAVVGGGAVASADAAPVPFTWSPSGAGLTGGDIVNADNYIVGDFAAITVDTTAGTFTETGALHVQSFLNGGTTVPASGLGSTYSLYLLFNGTGTLSGIPTVNGTSTNGTINISSYQLIGSSDPSPTFTVTNGNVAVGDSDSPVVLAFGDSVSGTGFVTLTKTANGYSPTANLNLNFTACQSAGQGGVCTGDESAFFVAPPEGLHLQISNFSATDTETTLTSSGTTTNININGGGGNLTFQAVPAPEPASLSLLGVGMIGLAAVVRRRRKG